MERRTALSVATVFLLLVSAVGVTAGVSPSGSLASDFDSSSTDTQTVVVAIGSPDTAQGRASLLAANAIANEHNYSVVRVPDDELPYSLVQTLSQRVEKDNLRHAIVVGVGKNTTDAVATAVTAVGAYVGGDDITLDVQDQITGESASDVLYRAAIQQWDRDSQSTVLLTTTTETDSAKSSIALANASISGTPVLAQSDSYADINATLDYLGANTVYVTPGVSSSTREDLQDDGYTVDESPAGVSLDQSVQKVAAGYAPDTAQDVVIVGEQDHIHAVSQVGGANNSTVLVADNPTTLGSTANAKISGLSAVDDIYVFGNQDDVSSEVFSSVSDNARSAANTSRVTRVHGYTEVYLRASLLTSGYTYGVLTTEARSNEDNVTVDITNIGYSTVQEIGNSSVTAAWSGDITSSSPTGEFSEGQWVVEHDEAIDPGETFQVTLQADRLDNGGHPELDYYVGSSDALIGTTGGLSFFQNKFQSLAGWFVDLVNPLLPGITLDPTAVWVEAVVFVAILVVAFGVVLVFREITLRRR